MSKTEYPTDPLIEFALKAGEKEIVLVKLIEIQSAELSVLKAELKEGYAIAVASNTAHHDAEVIRTMLKRIDIEVATPFIHRDYIKDYADDLDKE